MFSEPTLIAVEGSNQSALCVQHLAVLERQFSVSITFEDVSTTLDDFSHQDLEIVFDSDSETTQCIRLMISIDDLIETDEEFIAMLSTTDEDIDIVNGTTQITISDSSTMVVGFRNTTLTVDEGDDVSVCVAIFSGRLAPEVQLPLVIVSINAEGITKQ